MNFFCEGHDLNFKHYEKIHKYFYLSQMYSFLKFYNLVVLEVLLPKNHNSLRTVYAKKSILSPKAFSTSKIFKPGIFSLFKIFHKRLRIRLLFSVKCLRLIYRLRLLSIGKVWKNIFPNKLLREDALRSEYPPPLLRP